MNYHIKPIVFCLVSTFLIVFFLSGCDVKTSTQLTQTTASAIFSPPVLSNPIKGVSLSPRSYESADFQAFFPKAKEAGQVVTWAGDWLDLNKTDGSGAKVVVELSKHYLYIPLLEVQFFQQSTGELLRPLDDSTRQMYAQSLRAVVKNNNLKYIGVGIEVNLLFEKSQVDFNAFVDLFDQIYLLIKSDSPATQIFTIFQLEKMKGLSGGLFGGISDPGQSQWELLERFSHSDLVAFTTYPGLIYHSPSEIPTDYYSDIKNHTQKPIVFTEMGWHSEASPRGWESNEQKQTEFISRFFWLTSELEVPITIWSFLFDPNTEEPFRSMGLLRPDGSPRPAWNEWLKH